MFWFSVPIEVFPKLRNIHAEQILISLFIVLAVVLSLSIIAYGIKNYLRIIKIKKNAIPFDEIKWVLIDAKPVWSNQENGPNTIVGREGIVEWSNKKIYKQQEIKTFASEEDFEIYISEYKQTNKTIYMRIDIQNNNLYYIDFPKQQVMTGSGNIAEEGMLFLTRTRNLFCRPTSRDILVLPVLLLLILWIFTITLLIISLSDVSKKEIVFMLILWLWLILLSIIIIRRIYTDK